MQGFARRTLGQIVPAAIGFTVAVLIGALGAGPALAHGPVIPLEDWGGFPSGAARCQRLISRATSLCISQVTEARTACLGAQMLGGTCDEAALSARVSQARQRALDRMQRSCNLTHLQQLGYIDLADAQTDIVSACRQLDTAASSAIFGPVMVGGTIAGTDETTATCVQAAAAESQRLLRFAMRVRQQVLDRIASSPTLRPEQKRPMVQWATNRIARARAASAAAIDATCASRDFRAAYGRSAEAYLSDLGAQADCLADFVYIQDAVVCPAPLCGNGVHEAGEECDDGNDFDGDGCRGDCVKTDCEVFPSTFALIQQAIFENHGCTNDICHGAAMQNGLDLRAGASYAHLVDVPWSQDPTRKLIEPGDPQRSILWLKLAAKTLPDLYPADQLGIGTPMPSIGNGLSEEELEAVRQWIYAAASETASVPGVGDLLDGCTPEPEPIQIKPLDPPPAGEGVQLRMPAWTVDAGSESEVCFASYYDVTDQVPEELRGPNDTFCYNLEQLRQDPLSHHLIINLYIGSFAPDDPAWGEFRCVGGAKAGELCPPTEMGFCGEGSGCATKPVKGITCSGVGPPDPTQNRIQFAGAQQPNFTGAFPEGAYRCVPLKGMIMWNSHAFNLTDRDGDLQAWVNFKFAPTDQRKYFANGIFELASIFKMSVPAFQQQNVCSIKTFRANVATHLFELNSHMHSRGKRWRTYRGLFTCGDDGNTACDPLDPRQCADGVPCVERRGRTPEESLVYTSAIYNDPVLLRFDPPMLLQGNRANRSLTYCALYDNGFTDPERVKKQSTSPPNPLGGSTCPVATHCTTGRPQQPCSGAGPARHRSCDSSEGAMDGFCDACTLGGGVTTEDEMFLLLGSFYETPEIAEE